MTRSSPEAFEGLVSLEDFMRAQELLEQRRQKYEPGFMLKQLNTFYQQHGVFRDPASSAAKTGCFPGCRELASADS